MFIRSSLLFSILTFVSRIFGFIRDILLATFFGTSLYSDAFAIAYRLPNLFRSTFAEGALSAAFVPIFSKKLSHDGKTMALQFAGNVFGILVIALLCITVTLEIFMPFVIDGMAQGFRSDPYKFELTVFLARITTPYLFLVSLVAFYSCILNSMNKFFALAFSPIILNIVMIVGLYMFGENQMEKVVVAAWTIFIGGIIQLIVILRTIVNQNLFHGFKMPNLESEDVRKFFRNILPAFLSSSVTQLNIWIGTTIVSGIAGAASIIYFADRIVQLPASLIGVSMGVVLLPALSKSIKTGEHEKANFLHNRALEISLLLSLPCLVMTFVLAEPIIYILFQRGAFLASDTAKTAPALFTLAFGIPAYVMNKIIVSNFFAHEETKISFKIAIACLVFNVIGNLVLIKPMAHVGITLMTGLTGWLNTLLLVIFSYKKEIFKFDSLIKIKFLKICLSCVFLYIFLVTSINMVGKFIYSDSKFIALTSFCGIALASLAIYILALSATRTYSLSEIKKLL